MRLLAAQLLLVIAASLLSGTVFASHVVVLQQQSESTEGLPAPTPAMIAELALAGFTVSVQRLESDSDLMEALGQVTQRPGVIAGVSVEMRGDSSVGYLWLKGAAAPILVEERAKQAIIAHSVTVLKITELLLEHRLSLPTTEAVHSEAEGVKPSVVETSPTPEAAPAPSELALRTWAGAGVETLSFEHDLAWQLGASAELAITKQLSFAVAAAFPLSAYKRSSKLGTAEVRATDLGGGLQVTLLSLGHLDMSIGPRVGVRLLSATANSTAESQAKRSNARVLTVGAELRATYQVASVVLLGLLIRPNWLTPEPRLTSDTGDVVKLGSFAASGLLMLGWELGL